jgi:DNA-binding transcriptional MerR regulator
MMDRDQRRVRLTSEQLARRCGVPVTFVTRLVRHGVIEPEEAGFRPEVALLVLRVVRLRRDLGVNTQGAAVIVDLLRRIDDLERRLRHRGQA